MGTTIDFSAYSNAFFRQATRMQYEYEVIDALLLYAKCLYEKRLPIVYNQEHLSLLLGFRYEYLLGVSNETAQYYKYYSIPKRNGGIREIAEPFPALKEIQTWILRNILEPASTMVSPVAKAFMPGKNLRENARFHRKMNIVVALDLHDFFGSIRIPAIIALFTQMGYNKAVSVLLAHLCTLNGSLPQGAPTSPMLSNLIFFPLDNRISLYCRKRNIRYTRYADDMAFSSNNMDVHLLIKYIRMVVSYKGLKLNEEKTKVMGRGTQHNVTGVIVNEKLQVAKSYRDKVRQEFYYLIRYGLADHFNRVKHPAWITSSDVYLRHLYGRVNHILQINPYDKEFIEYKNVIGQMISGT